MLLFSPFTLNCILLAYYFKYVPGGVGHGSRDSIRPIKCHFRRGNGGYIFRWELRIGCRFSTDFCAHRENQTKIFLEVLVQYLGQLSAKSQRQVSIFSINFSQWKSLHVENVCLSSTLDMDILLVVCGVTGISNFWIIFAWNFSLTVEQKEKSGAPRWAPPF